MLEGYADDILYLKILFVSFAASLFGRRLPSAFRDWYSAGVGLVLVAFVCRLHLLYSLFCVLGNLLILQLEPHRKAPFVCFVFTFLYLGFVRCAHHFDLPKPIPHANAVQLLMTLRCVGLAYELADEKEKAIDKTAIGGSLSRSPLHCFLYLYNFAGLFTGPYYSYRVHTDNIRCENLEKIPVISEIRSRLLAVPFCVVMLVVVSTVFPLKYMESDEFYTELNFLSRLAYMAPVFLYLRMRVYTAWLLSESSCIAGGIGAYPIASKPRVGQGPTDLEKMRDAKDETEYSFETVRNIDIYRCEMCDGGFRSGIRGWNRSVQYWLAACVYKRTPRSVGKAWTMLVSAFWHGIHPGYYLAFLTLPISTYVEEVFFETFQLNDSSPADGRTRGEHVGNGRKKLLLRLWWFFRMRGFEYMSTGFLLLSWNSTLRYWGSTYYCFHLSLLTIWLFCQTVRFVRKFRNEKSE